MGLDREVPVASGKKLTLDDRRMKTPWSAEALNDESPAHTVFLDPYFIDRYEVSNKDYGEFIKATGHSAPAYWDDPRLNNQRQPVVGVNWDDAKAYCEHRGKRLPTEAEWEKAARGPHGNSILGAMILIQARPIIGKNELAATEVDSYREGASYYGAYNMAGNAFEWVSDWYDPATTAATKRA